MQAVSKSSAKSSMISWVCFALVVMLVAFWVVYFPIERAYFRSLVESINAELPASTGFFLAGAWWKIPALAILIGLVAVTVQIFYRNRSLAIISHATSICVCLGGMVIYREGVMRYLLELVENI